MKNNNKAHWEGVYTNKTPDQVSWTEPVPQTSLDFIHGFELSKSSSIIDVGGGDSRLVDYLLMEGFQDITVLDISAAAIEKAKVRLGWQSRLVKWVVADITQFEADRHYDVWHDRATFHFMTNESQIAAYLKIAGRAITNYMVVGTFSENGPAQCSGLPVRQYSEEQLQSQLNEGFTKVRCIHEDHLTPFQTRQNFLFCSFKKRPVN